MVPETLFFDYHEAYAYPGFWDIEGPEEVYCNYRYSSPEMWNKSGERRQMKTIGLGSGNLPFMQVPVLFQKYQLQG